MSYCPKCILFRTDFDSCKTLKLDVRAVVASIAAASLFQKEIVKM